MDYIDLGRRIRKQRTQRGWTQEALAERVNVSTSFVGHVERGTRKASLETLVSIANVLDVSLDYLLSGSINSSVIGPMPLCPLNSVRPKASAPMPLAASRPNPVTTALRSPSMECSGTRPGRDYAAAVQFVAA